MPDNMTREQAIDLERYPNWIAMVKEMDKIIAGESEKLLHAPTEDVLRLQERVKALRFCTRFPGIIAEREETEPEPKKKILRA